MPIDQEMPKSFDVSRGIAIVRGHQDLAALVALRAWLQTCQDRALLVGLAEAMPQKLKPLPDQFSLELSRLATVLVPYGLTKAEDVTTLSPRLRALWLRTYINAGQDPGPLSDTILLQVVTGWPMVELFQPQPLIARMVQAQDPRIRLQAIDLIRRSAQRLCLSGQEVFEHVQRLAKDPEPRVREAAQHEWVQPLLGSLRPKQERARREAVVGGLSDAFEPVVGASVQAACGLGYTAELRDLLFERTTPLKTRRSLLQVFGDLAGPEDLGPVIRLALEAKLAFGSGVRQCLLQMHRRGIFVGTQDLDNLLLAFDQHQGWTPEDFVRVTYIVRVELMARLAELSPDDQVWIRRAGILGAAYRVGAHELIAEMLDRCTQPAIAKEFVRAAGASPEFTNEASLLDWLPRLPEAVIPVLRQKGTADAQCALRAIVDEPLTSYSLRKLAFNALWAHSEDRGRLMAEVAEVVGPSESGLLDTNRAPARDSTVADLVAGASWPASTLSPKRRLSILCESARPGLRPAIVAQFRELFAHYLGKALQGDFMIKRELLPELEQMLFRHGRYLVAAGRCVRPWVDSAPETGRDFVLAVALEWLQEEPSIAVRVALLELLERHAPSGQVLRMIEPYWRHNNKSVQRAAVAAIVAGGSEADGLQFSLCALVGARDARICRQGLDAVAAMGATWAEPMVRENLGRPEMSVKKAAAEALIVVGTVASVPDLVSWLGRHDNSGFRLALKDALRTSAGCSANAVLVEALNGAGERRTTELLWDALSGSLSLAEALLIAAADTSAGQALVQACLKGKLRLCDASPEQFAARLHLAQRLRDTPKDDPARELRRHGFSPEAALRLIDLRNPKTEAAVLEAVRDGLSDWLNWLTDQGAAHDRAGNLVLAAATHTHHEHFTALLDCAARLAARIDPPSLVGFIERSLESKHFTAKLRGQAISLLTTTPGHAEVGGLRRYALLGRLDAVRTRSDLVSALRECRLRPDYAAESFSLLTDALQIPIKDACETEDMTELRDKAKDWWHRVETERIEWLDQVLELRALDLPIALELGPYTKAAFAPVSHADRAVLLADLSSNEAQRRQRAVGILLGWLDADAHREILSQYLAGRIEVPRSELQAVANALSVWPKGAQQRRRARSLVTSLEPERLQSLLPGWIEDWKAGDEGAERVFESFQVQYALLPWVRDALQREDLSLLPLLRRDGSAAQQAIVSQWQDREPTLVAHLVSEDHEADEALEAVSDPIEEAGLVELEVLVRDLDQPDGLAVRAIHAMATYGAEASTSLSEFVTDARPKVRSAALRAFRLVASRQEVSEAMVGVLSMESREEVSVRLMSSLGHAKYEPALDLLIARVLHSNYRMSRGARAALRAWGPDAVLKIEHASRKARPDRRSIYDALISDIEALDPPSN